MVHSCDLCAGYLLSSVVGWGLWNEYRVFPKRPHVDQHVKYLAGDPRPPNIVAFAFGSLIPADFLTLTQLGLDGSSTVHFGTSEGHLSSHSCRTGYPCPAKVL
jgi:hypothetical protein